MINSMKVKLLLSALFASIVSFFDPVMHLLVPMLYLILFDVVTGMYVAKFVDRIPLTSRRFLRKLPQLVLLTVAISAALNADPFFVNFGLSQNQGASFVISFYGVYEVFSIFENLGKSGLPVAKQLTKILQAKLPQEIQDELKKDE